MPDELDMPALTACLRNTKMHAHTGTCTRVFLIAQFTTVPNWKHPKCPSAGEWMTEWDIEHGETLLSNAKEQAEACVRTY